MRCNKSYVKD